MGKQERQLFPGKRPTTAQHQPAESPENGRNTPKATPGHKRGALSSVGRACPPSLPPAHQGAQGRRGRRAAEASAARVQVPQTPGHHRPARCAPSSAPLAQGPERSSTSSPPSPQQRRLPNGCAKAAHRGPWRGPARRGHLAVPRATPEGRAGGWVRGQRGRAGRPRRGAGRRGSGAGRGLTFAAARLRSSWSRRAAASSSSQKPSRGTMVVRPGRPGPAGIGGGRRRALGGPRRAAQQRRAGTRALRTVRGAAARGGDLSAARRAPQFVGAAPSPRRRAGGVSKGRTLPRG